MKTVYIKPIVEVLSIKMDSLMVVSAPEFTDGGTVPPGVDPQ
ncbi:MAG: hypothetical protein UIC49_00120 [Paludibacteraceae bacterium]|nr:hypothetical protein [Paludibacteraceae bacterium]